jgi:hypothetical protein
MKAIYMAKIKMAAAVIAGVAVIARTSADPQPRDYNYPDDQHNVIVGLRVCSAPPSQP